MLGAVVEGKGNKSVNCRTHSSQKLWCEKQCLSLVLFVAFICWELVFSFSTEMRYWNLPHKNWWDNNRKEEKLELGRLFFIAWMEYCTFYLDFGKHGVSNEIWAKKEFRTSPSVAYVDGCYNVIITRLMLFYRCFLLDLILDYWIRIKGLCTYRLGMCMECWTSCKHWWRSRVSFRYWSRRRKVLNNSLLLMGMIIVVAVMSWRFWGISVWLVCCEFIASWVTIILAWSACFPLTLVNRVSIPVS